MQKKQKMLNSYMADIKHYLINLFLIILCFISTNCKENKCINYDEINYINDVDSIDKFIEIDSNICLYVSDNYINDLVSISIGDHQIIDQQIYMDTLLYVDKCERRNELIEFIVNDNCYLINYDPKYDNVVFEKDINSKVYITFSKGFLAID